MKKKTCGFFLTFVIGLILVLSSCSKANIKDEKFTFTVTDTFNEVVKYNEMIDFTGVELIGDHGTLVNVTNDLVVSGGETNKIGENQVTLNYNEATITIDYIVKYEVVFLVDNAIYDKQMVLSSNEVIIPENPNKNDLDFIGWDYGKNFPTLTDNLETKALFSITSSKIPNIDLVIDIEYGSSLTNLVLPSNEYGKWTIDEIANLGNAGTIHKAVARFIPTDTTLADVTKEITLRVIKQKVNIVVDNTSLIYNGQEQLPTYKLPEGLEELEVLTSIPQKAPGDYEYRFEIDDSNYEGLVEGDYKISKAKITINLPSINVIFGDVVSIKENIVYVNDKEVANITYDGNFIDGEEIEINISIPTLTVGNTNFIVEIDEENPYYQNYDINVNGGNIKVDKYSYSEDEISLPTITASYLDKLSDVEIPQSDNDGIFTYKDDSIVLDKVGNYPITLIFTPTNPNFNTVEVEVDVIVGKKVISISANDLEFTYNGEIQKPTKYIIEDGLTVNVINNTGDNINAGTYNYALEIDDECYQGYTSGQYVINKAEAKIEGTPNTISYSKDLGIPEWKYEITGLVGNDKAEDLLGFNIKVTKPEVNGVNTYKYNIEATSTNYIFEVINNILEVTQGTYSLDYNIDLPIINNATYEMTLADIDLSSYNSQGVFKWLDENISLVVSENYEAKATFTPKDNNYKSEEVTITFNVNKKDLSNKLSIDNNKFVYNGEIQQPKVELSDYELVVDSILVDSIDAGSYDYKFIINNDNYSGEINGTYVIDSTSVTIYIPNKVVKWQTNGLDTTLDLSELEVKKGQIYNSDNLNIKATLQNQPNGVGEYKYSLVAENKNYNVTFEDCYLIVEKGTYENIKDPTINATFEDILTNSNIIQNDPRGKWTFKDGSYTVNSINNKVLMIFTPSLIDDYEVVEKEIEFIANKKDLSNLIFVDENEYVYIADGINVVAKVRGYEDVEVKLTSEKGTNVGEYNYSYEIVSDYYTGNKTIEITINKAEAKIEGTVNTISYSKDLKVPEWKYTITGLVGNDSADNLLGLDIKVTKPEINGVNTYTYSVEATSTNYIFEVTNNTLEVTKGTYSSDYEITNPNVSSATVEDKLGDLTINDTDQGRFSWLNNEEVISSAGSNSYKATFTPKDSNYKSEEVTITFNVNTKDISDYINVDESSLKAIYDGKEHNIEVTISYKENSYDYSLSEYDKVNAGNKEITITINDDNYSGSKEVTLVIEKATIQFTKPNINDLPYNTNISSIELGDVEGGRFVLISEGIIEVGENNIKIKFIPNDTTNYKEEEFEIIVIGLRLESVITNENIPTLIYNGQIQDILKYFSVNNNEQQITLSYKLNGEVVDSIKNAGTYEVTASVAESDHYKASSIIINVKLEVEVPEVVLTAYYGDSIINIETPTSDYGIWSWDNSELVLKTIGENDYVAVFTSTDGETIVKAKITIKVEKKDISNTIAATTTTFIYTGSEIMPIVKGIGVDSEDVEVKLTSEKGINVGKYNYSYEIVSDYYIGNKTIEITINKAEAKIEGTVNTISYSKDLKVPEWKYTITGLVGNDSADNLLGLDIKVTKPEVNGVNTYTYSVEATSTNYIFEVTNNTLEITQGTYSSDYEITNPNVSSATVEDKLGDLTINDTDQGTFSWLNNEEVINSAGSNSYKATFTPKDNNYKSEEVTITFNVNKKDISDYINVDESSLKAIYDGSEHNIEVTISYKENTYDYSLSEYDKVNAGDKEITITINDNNYSGSKVVTLVIEKATIQFTKPNINDLPYKTNISSIELGEVEGGRFELISGGIIEVGENNIKVKFIPNDTTNYKEEEFKIIVIGLRLESVITNEEIPTLTYNGQNQDILDYFSVNNNEQEITLSYKLNGEVVDSIKNAGTYEVTASVSESEHYLADSITVEVEVIIKAPTDTKTAYYGDKLEDVFIAEDELGNWSWKEPNTDLREIGEHPYIAIFSPIDGSESEEIEIKVNVEKKDISNTIEATTTTFTYTGNEIMPTVKGIGVDDEDVEVKLTSEKGTNVGEYNYSYEIVSDYYIGNKTIEITINKAEAKIEGTVNTISYSKDLKVPEWKYTITGLVGNDSADNLLGLDIKVTKPEINGVNTYTYSVEATSTNYIFEVTNNTLEVTKGIYSNDYNIDLPIINNATYEMTLADIDLSSYNSQGVFKWLDENISLVVSENYEAKATFTPKDNNYKSEEVTITFNVNKKDISDYINVDESSLKTTYDGNEHTIKVTISYKENTYNYLLSEYDKVNAGNKEITITINDDNYSGSKEVTLVIEKATIQFTKPTINDLPYNTNISSIELGDVEGGRFVLISEGIIEVGENNIKIKFIPNDTTNYKEEEFEIIVIGLRLESVITNENIPTLIYNGQIQDILKYFSVNNNEQQITLSYKLNGEVVDSIKNAGTYEVTASVSESEHYKASSIIINVKLEVEVPEIILTAYYGDGIINIETPTSDYGIWSWDNSELVLKTIGEKGYVAVFTSTDGETIVKAKITIKVEKKDISNTIEATTTTFTYTGHEIMPIVKGIGVDNEDVEVKLTSEKGTNVGKYNYIYEIVSDYYTGNKTIEITINKAEAKIEGTVNTISYSKDLKVPEWKYTITGLVGNDSAEGLLGLDIKVTKPEINGVNTYTYSVEATSTNYIFEVTNNTLEVTQGIYSSDYEITNPNVSSATVEDKLGDLTINDTDQGRFSWLNNEEVINSAGSNSYKATFTPNDNNYKSEEVTITFNVNTKDISNYINVDESSLKTTYDGSEHNIEVTISYNENTYNYLLSEYDKVNAGNKEITITINDDNYSGSKVVTLVINKKTAILAANSQTMNFGENVPDLKYVVNNLAPNDSEDVLGIVVTKPTVTDVITYQYVINYNKNGNYELEITGDLSLIVNKGNYDIDSILKPTVGVITIGMDYANISITQKDDRGIFSITNNGIIGKNNVLNLHFEPKDNRYNSFDTTMTFTFKKVDISDQIIVPDERTFTYTGEPITFEASIDSSYGVTLKYSDNVQTSIGNYETSITIVENDYYEGSTFTNWSIVAPNYDDLDKPEFENVEYLDYLRDLVFDANADYRGTYSITNPNIQIDVVGEYEITLTFTPHDENVAPKEVTVTIQVNKKDISENINVVINETLIYNGQEQTPTATITISGYEQYSIPSLFVATSGINAGKHDYVVNISDNEFFTGNKKGQYIIEKAEVKITISGDEITYLPDLVIDSDHFTYNLISGQFYGNDSSGLVFKVDNDAIINGGYGKYPVTVEFANENYDLSYDPFNLIVNRKYDYDEINISKAMQDSEESIYTPIYGPNNMILGIMLNGTYNTEFDANDLKVTLTKNNGDISELTRVDQNINGYYITLNLTGFSTTTEVTLTLALKEAPKEVYSNLKIKVMNGVTNITTINETKAWAINTNSVLNNDLVYNPNERTKGYSFVGNRLVYTSPYIEGAQNENTAVINLSKILYGNGYKIDGSLLNVSNSANDNKLIASSSGTLDNIEIKLATGPNYKPTAAFNISAACVSITDETTIRNTLINGGMRGVRVLGNLTLENVTFKNNIVAIEAYQGKNGVNYNVNLNGVDVISKIEDPIYNSGTTPVSMTLAVLFFPGSGGAGIKNFHMTKINFNDFSYDGWVKSNDAYTLVNTLAKGVLSSASIDQDTVDKCYDSDDSDGYKTTVNINNEEYVNLAVVVPTYMSYVIFKYELSLSWDDTINLKNIYPYKIQEAAYSFLLKLNIYLMNVADSSFDYSEHFKMSGSTPIGVIELSDFIFHY